MADETKPADELFRMTLTRHEVWVMLHALAAYPEHRQAASWIAERLLRLQRESWLRNLVSDSALAEELFGTEQLEAHAQELRKKKPR